MKLAHTLCTAVRNRVLDLSCATYRVLWARARRDSCPAISTFRHYCRSLVCGNSLDVDCPGGEHFDHVDRRSATRCESLHACTAYVTVPRVCFRHHPYRSFRMRVLPGSCADAHALRHSCTAPHVLQINLKSGLSFQEHCRCNSRPCRLERGQDS